MLAAAGTFASAALIAAVTTAPSAAAGTSEGDAPAGNDRSTAAHGVAVAAARAAKKGVDWKDCPESWGLAKPIQCGYVTVPVDYARPDGRTIDLAVDRARSTGSKDERQGSLIYNPGGPGGSGLDFPKYVTEKDPVQAKPAKAYDYVGFDPRGVGHSAPISCADPQEFAKAPKPDPVPADEADKRAHRKLAAEYAQGCKERSGGDLLPHMNTPNTARDLDVIRAALGDAKLNYLGVSYGTYLGAVYAELFPSHVRRMVFDSVVNPATEKIWYQANLDQDVAFQGRWTDWTKWVAEHDDVYGIGATRAEVQRQWDELRAKAKKDPVGGVVGPAELLGLFQKASYSDGAWAPVAAVWSAYLKGDEKPLLKAAGPDMSNTAKNKEDENGNAVYTAVQCNDANWPTDWRTWDRDSTRLHPKNPFLTWSNTWMNLPCATWPLKQREPVDVHPGKALPATLVVQSERDAATPYAGAVELHKRLHGSRLITEKDAGNHGVTGLRNACVNERVDAYLLKGETGKKDVTCAAHEAPEPETS
ncbi:alpha/beta hydrolase [Streptomyces sp. MZ04]|uniref:alpha/beta hydrolase n=1 Tax=Streptomyces sp. MZ04 TaxID=2559236 RepID=UPI00107E9FA6|nr:alpha/beta hydrolase [Streptomyces sp. MZ04]TGB14944.1 alpha/beta hydrolase [Streptomyces sp. MZ04]